MGRYGESYFVGIVAMGNNILNQDLYTKSIALRNEVYVNHNWREPDDPETDNYDTYSMQFAIALGSKVLQTCRLVIGDEAHPIPLEEYFGDVKLAEKRAEVSRLAGSMEGASLSDRVALNRLLHAKMCMEVLKDKITPYALIERPLERLLKRSGIVIEKISDDQVLEHYDNSVNFVARMDPETTLVNMERSLGISVTRACNYYEFTEDRKIKEMSDVELK